MKRFVSIVLTVLFFASPQALASHGTNNAGREFLFSFLPTGDFPSQNQLVEVELIADTATDVLVEYPIIAPRFRQTFSVVPGRLTIVILPVEAVTAWVPNLPLDNGVRLSANSSFSAFLVTNNTAPDSRSGGQTGGRTLALPVGVLNTQYIVATYNSAADVAVDRAVFTVTAVYNNTTVTITPSANLLGSGTKGVPFQVTLNRGQSYLVEDEKPNPNGGLAGTLVAADKPVSVSNGNICTKIPANIDFCDMVFEIAVPVQEWSAQFIVKHDLHLAGSVYRYNFVYGSPDTPGRRFIFLSIHKDDTVFLDGQPVDLAAPKVFAKVPLSDYVIGTLVGDAKRSLEHARSETDAILARFLVYERITTQERKRRQIVEPVIF